MEPKMTQEEFNRAFYATKGNYEHIDQGYFWLFWFDQAANMSLIMPEMPPVNEKGEFILKGKTRFIVKHESKVDKVEYQTTHCPSH